MSRQGRSYGRGGTGGTVPWGYEGGRVTQPTIPEFLAEFVTSGFQRPGSNLYFIQFLTNFILFYFFVI